MWFPVALALFLMASAFMVVFYWRQRRVRQRALQVLRWIENSLGSQGHVTGMRWVNPTQFEVPLRLLNHLFLRPRIQVYLHPPAFPFHRTHTESITFLSDLDLRPNFSMTFKSLRWFARSRKDLSTEAPGWQVSNFLPVMLTTRLDWEQEVTNALQSVLHCEQRENVDVVFRPTSPNFSATLPLSAIAPGSKDYIDLLSVMRNMAEGVSTNKA